MLRQAQATVPSRLPPWPRGHGGGRPWDPPWAFKRCRFPNPLSRAGRARARGGGLRLCEVDFGCAPPATWAPSPPATGDCVGLLGSRPRVFGSPPSKPGTDPPATGDQRASSGATPGFSGPLPATWAPSPPATGDCVGLFGSHPILLGRLTSPQHPEGRAKGPARTPAHASPSREPGREAREREVREGKEGREGGEERGGEEREREGRTQLSKRRGGGILRQLLDNFFIKHRLFFKRPVSSSKNDF